MFIFPNFTNVQVKKINKNRVAETKLHALQEWQKIKANQIKEL